MVGAVADAEAPRLVTGEVVVGAIRTVVASEGAATEEDTEVVIAVDSGEATVVGFEAVIAAEASEEATGAEEGAGHPGSRQGECLPAPLPPWALNSLF